MNTKIAILCAILSIVVALSLIAGAVVMILNNQNTEVDPQVALQEAGRFYREYSEKYGMSVFLYKHYLYVASDECVVLIENGKVVDVYGSREEALAAVVDSPDVGLLADTGNGKLFAYTNPIKKDSDDMLSILAIGNSFSIDAMEYVANVAMDLGVKEVYIGNLYIGGCSLKTHTSKCKANVKAYQYFINENGQWNRSTDQFPANGNDMSVADALQSHAWDYVTLQQASGQSGEADTYNEDLEYMISYVKAHAPGAKLVWNMTWAYQQDSDHQEFAKYDNDQMTMYNAITSAVQSKILGSGAFTHVVPSATAVQNSRTSVLGDTTTMDGFHMNRPFGRYLLALIMVKTITGLSIDEIGFAPAGLTEEQKRIAIESANNAAKTPYAVTESQYK